MKKEKFKFQLTEDAKRRYANKENFFSIKNILVVLIFGVILFGMWSPWNRPLREQAKAQNKAHLKLLHEAVAAYKDIWGALPYSQANYHGSFNFAEKLSKIAINDSNFDKEKRPMILDFRKCEFYLSSEDFDRTINPSATTILDPYEQEYIYVYDKITDSFYIYSLGIDGEAGTDDDIRSDKLR